MEVNLALITEIITILLGIGTFYGVVTKPIKDCILELKNEIKSMASSNFKTREDLVKVVQSAKAAHKRLDKMEGKNE